MKHLRGVIARFLEQVEAGGLRLHEFTAIFPLGAGRRPSDTRTLKAYLSELDGRTPSPYRNVPGLHAARWILLEGTNPSAHAGRSSVGPLMFSCVFDGDMDDLLDALVEQTADELNGLLQHCATFPGTADGSTCVDYLRSHRVRTQFFFRDNDASVGEVQRATEVRRRFTEFVTAHQSLTSAELRRAFERFCRGAGNAPSAAVKPSPASPGPAVGYPFELSRPFERLIDQEHYWVRRAAELARSRSRRDTRRRRREDPSAAALRGVHSKHHGCLLARFLVREDLLPRLRQGVFVPGREYQALVRVSNSFDSIRPDRLRDARGLAIKLLDVGDCGRQVLSEPPTDGLPRGVGAPTQDFLMVSFPTFFIKDVRDYTIFRSIVDSQDKTARLVRGTIFGLRRSGDVMTFARTMLQTIDHPLRAEYYSMTPSLLGDDLVVKYSVRPLASQTDEELAWRRTKGARKRPDYLRETLQTSLDPVKGSTFRMEFALDVPEGDVPPVEDPRQDWRRWNVRRVPVATLIIEPQNFTTEARMDLCQNLVFTPWHSLEEHKPLGSLNRARLSVYQASADTRRALNRVAESELDAAADAPIPIRPPQGRPARGAAVLRVHSGTKVIK